MNERKIMINIKNHMHKWKVLRNIQDEYIIKFLPNITKETIIPIDYVNTKLKRRKENWRLELIGSNRIKIVQLSV
jgi:hypothetical protein